MSSLIHWDPFGELMSLRQAMDRLFEESFVHPTGILASLREGPVPALDIYETDGAVVVKASVPGMKPEDIDITITGDVLTIKGEAKTEEEIKKENYHRQERRYGAFTRTVELPPQLQTDRAEATFEQGVLTLTIPKAEEIKPKAIKIKTKELAGAPK